MLFNEKKMIEKPEFDKCFIDGDSMLYRIAATVETDTLAKSTFDNALKAIMRETQSTDGYVSVKGQGNFRHDLAEDYKANRKKSPMPEEIRDRLSMLYEYSWETGCVPSDNCEADDIVSIWATEAGTAGESCVIAHIDKDIDMIPGWHYNFNKKILYHIDADQGHYNFCKQLLTGDSSDNIQGLKGVGPKTAEKLLNGVESADMLEVVANTWQEKHPSDWYQRLNMCFNLIYMRTQWGQFHELDLFDVFKVEKKEDNRGPVQDRSPKEKR